jgi:hypothetical protein
MQGSEARAILLPHGSLPILERCLDRFGRSYKLTYADGVTLEHNSHGQALTIEEFVDSGRFGTIRYNGFRTLIALVIAICRIDLHSAIAIAVPTKSLAARIERRLQILGHGHHLANGRLQVATPAKLKNLPQCDLCLLVNAHQFRSATALLAYRHTWRARRFALVPTNEHLNPTERDRLAILFGFHTFHYCGDGFVGRDIRVKWEATWGGARITSSPDDRVAFLREAVWHNGMRNRRIANASSAAAASATVAVLAENIEHARNLGERLADWPIVSAGSPAAHRHCIVTTGGAQKLDWSRIDVLVRGDAGVGLPIGNRLDLPIPLNGRRRLLVVDFDDRRLHPSLGQRYRQRRAAYLEQGWYGPELDVIAAQIDAFIDRRLLP